MYLYTEKKKFFGEVYFTAHAWQEELFRSLILYDKFSVAKFIGVNKLQMLYSMSHYCNLVRDYIRLQPLNETHFGASK